MIYTSIVHINSYYLSNKLHGELVEQIEKEDLNIRQLIYIPYPISGPEVLNFYDNNFERSKVVFSRCFSNFSRIIWPLKVLQIYKDYKLRFKTTQISITHSHSLISNGIISYLNYKANKTPYIVTVRNTDINIFLKRSFIFRKLGEKILHNASNIIMLSPAYRDKQLKKYISPNVFSNIENKIQVIPNGVNDFWIDNLLKTKKKISEVIEILFVGKLRENKNIIGVLSSCEILSKRGIKLKLTIAGDGYLKEKILSNKYNFPINYLGHVESKEDLLHVYRKSNLLIVPSFKESFGLVYVEAMTQGLPVIYTKRQGFDGYFEDGVIGYSVEPVDYEDIANKVQLIIDNYEEMSNNAIQESIKFSWEEVSKQLVRLYNKTV